MILLHCCASHHASGPVTQQNSKSYTVLSILCLKLTAITIKKLSIYLSRLSPLCYNHAIAYPLRTLALTIDLVLHLVLTISQAIHLSLSITHHPNLSSNLDPANKNLAHKLQPGHKHTQQTRNHKVTDARPDIQPAPLVPNHPEEIHRQHIADAHHHHKEARGCDTEPPVQDAEVGADDGERDEQF